MSTSEKFTIFVPSFGQNKYLMSLQYCLNIGLNVNFLLLDFLSASIIFCYSVIISLFFQFQGLIQAFDDDDDQTLTADEKTTLITTLASNPEIALYKFILNQKVQIPILPYFGACGRLSFVQARIPLHF